MRGTRPPGDRPRLAATPGTRDPIHEVSVWRFLESADAHLAVEPDHVLAFVWRDEFIARVAERPTAAERDALLAHAAGVFCYPLADALARVDELRRERVLGHG